MLAHIATGLLGFLACVKLLSDHTEYMKEADLMSEHQFYVYAHQARVRGIIALIVGTIGLFLLELLGVSSHIFNS